MVLDGCGLWWASGGGFAGGGNGEGFFLLVVVVVWVVGFGGWLVVWCRRYYEKERDRGE